MKEVKKYYYKNEKLKILKGRIKENVSIIRMGTLNNKKYPCCDWRGICTNKAYAEVYPFLGKRGKRKGWSYLCKKHYYQEQKRLKWKLPACLKVEW